MLNVEIGDQASVSLTLDVQRLALDVSRLQTQLAQSIAETIRQRGPQTFAWFMEQALYHPLYGYYSSDRAAIGRQGDYFTNVSVGPVFGHLLAAQFAEIWQQLEHCGRSHAPTNKLEIRIIEQGAHHGQLARDLLTAARKRWPTFFPQLRYKIIEPFPVLQTRQSETLREFGTRVSWEKSLSAVDPFVGVHFSNELIDSMPVHLIVSTGHGWNERFVAIEADRFVFIDHPIVDAKLKAQVAKLPERAAGYETEVNLAALDWIDELSAKLAFGYVIVIDYGFPRDQFYAPFRTAGTLQVRAQHRHLASPLEQIGQADISAHVDWTSLIEQAQERGFRVHGFNDQHWFIAGIVSELVGEDFEKTGGKKNKRELQTLMHPEMLGRVFQVLALEKRGRNTASLRQSFGSASRLAGFRFAREVKL